MSIRKYVGIRSALCLLLSGAIFSAAGANRAMGEDDKGKTTSQRSNILDFSDGTPTGGASFLMRDNGGVWLEGHAKGLGVMYAYTVWFIVFNRPDNCVDGCGEDDLENASVRPSVLWGGGFISDADGQGHFAAHTEKRNPLGEVLFGPGLLSPRKAEIHFVIRCHGPVIPELAADQIGTFGGACDVNQCEDVQFGVHMP